MTPDDALDPAQPRVWWYLWLCAWYDIGLQATLDMRSGLDRCALVRMWGDDWADESIIAPTTSSVTRGLLQTRRGDHYRRTAHHQFAGEFEAPDELFGHDMYYSDVPDMHAPTSSSQPNTDKDLPAPSAYPGDDEANPWE